MRERRKLIREGAWVVAGRLATIVGGLAGIRLLTEVVSPRVFGGVTLLLGFLSLGQNLLCSPMMQAGQRYYADTSKGVDVGALRSAMDRHLVRGTAVLVLLMLVVGLVFGDGLSTGLRLAVVMGALAVVEIWKTTEMGMLGAARRQRPLAIWQGLEAWGMPACAAALAWTWRADESAVLAGYVAASGLLLAAVLAFRVKRIGAAEKVGCDPRDAADVGRAMRRYALPFIPMAVIVWVTALGDRYVIGSLVGLREVGIYAACYGIVGRPFLMVHGALAQTLRPLYFETVSARRRARERRVFLIWGAGTALTGILGVVGFTLLGGFVARLLLAREFHAGIGLMPWLAAGHAALIVAQLFEARLFAYKRSRGVLLAQAVSAAVSLALLVPMALRHGLLGVAIACPIYFTVQAALTGLLAMRVGRAEGPDRARGSAGPAVPSHPIWRRLFPEGRVVE